MRTIWRYEVPIDDKPHKFTLRGEPGVVVAAKGLYPNYAIEFWAEYDDSREPFDMWLEVYGTGHKIPDDALHWATAPRMMPNGFVFHLYEVSPPNPEFPGD